MDIEDQEDELEELMEELIVEANQGIYTDEEGYVDPYPYEEAYIEPYYVDVVEPQPQLDFGENYNNSEFFGPQEVESSQFFSPPQDKNETRLDFDGRDEDEETVSSIQLSTKEEEELEDAEEVEEEIRESASLNNIDPDDIYGIGVSQTDGMATSLPKMRTRFSMSNQQILNLIDPHNQKAFEDNISRLNNLLSSNQNEYCAINFKGNNPETNEFRLSRKLLTKLVYKDELDLAGNFLQKTVGRRLNDKDMPELAEFLSNESQVTKLNLSYNDFEDEAIAILAGVLLARTDIHNINLAHNNFTPAGCFQFLQGLMTRPCLHSLKLAGNKIGQEGFDGLICLVMCGKGPHDLDVSESDMTMALFQGLCSAWQALDRDEDAPKFLLDHPPPIPLEILSDMKVANNEIKKQEYTLIQRRSLVELIRKDAGDMMGESGMEKIPEIPKEAALPDPVQLVEKVSASILEGLFEITELKMMEKGDTEDEITLDRGQAKIDNITKESEKLPDTELIIDEYKQIKEAGCIPFDERNLPVIVCPSLYSLEVDNVLDMGVSDTAHFIPSALDDLVEGAKDMVKGEEKKQKAPNFESADKAAEKVVARTLQEAARLSTATEYPEKSDATQVLLATILSTCQKVRDIEGSTSSEEFKEEALKDIWEASTKQATNIIYNRIPPERCSLTPDEVMTFVRKFMESSNRTLLRLLQNPFIPPLLFDVGTELCREIADQEDSKGGSSGQMQPSSAAGPNNAQKIIMSFLEGAISTAANLIGSGDPFSFRKQPAKSLAATLEKSKLMVENAEEKVAETVDNMILAGASLALYAENTNKELGAALESGIDPAADFLEETFDQVANLVIEMDKRRKDLVVEVDTPMVKYPFASRPNRLVLNRPLFQDFEAIMGAKMGDFLRTNTSLKCLHMRKWNLNEEGMISLMDGLSQNSNIVLLDLSSNAIGSQGAKCLAKFIQNNPKLKHLILSHNRLRNPGIRSLSDAFLGSNVEFLNIAYNDIAESLEYFLEVLPHTKIRSLYAIGNHFNQNSWTLLKKLFDTDWLIPKHCDFVLQDVDGSGMIVRNSQVRDVNEWYDVQPMVSEGLHRAPYFEETAHITAYMSEIS